MLTLKRPNLLVNKVVEDMRIVYPTTLNVQNRHHTILGATFKMAKIL